MAQASTFIQYEDYRDSGIDWIGDIPEHWKSEKAKWLFEKKERHVRPEDDVVTAFRDGEVTLRSNRRTEGFTNALQEHGYQGIRKGDLVIHAMDAFAGAIGVSDSDGKSTPVYAACVNRGEYYTNNHYYAYFLRYMAKSGYIESLSKGIRERSTDFRFNDFARLALPIPPREEQDRIANFLDHKTAEIDAAIAKKRRLIELLKEQKAILINQAVTKGLNPDVPMRDSGVEWIGGVPEHWGLLRNKVFLKLKKKLVGKRASSFKLLSLTLGGVIPRDMENPKGKFPAEFDTYQVVSDGDFVFCLFDVEETPRTVGLSSHNGIITGAYTVYECNKLICPEYLYYFYLVMDEGKKLRPVYTGLRNTIPKNIFGSLKLPVPPRLEQKAIVQLIKSAEQVANEACQKKSEEIRLLMEYKQILIANTVTGKIKL